MIRASHLTTALFLASAASSTFAQQAPRAAAAPVASHRASATRTSTAPTIDGDL